MNSLKTCLDRSGSSWLPTVKTISVGLLTVAAISLSLVSLGCGDDSGGGGGAGGQGSGGPGGNDGEGGASQGGADGVSIQCEDETCSFCCNQGVCADDEDACLAGGDEGGRAILHCDGTEDCDDGMVCCAGTPAGSFAFVSECQTASSCSSLPLPIFFCHDRGECAFGEECLPWEFADYVKTCQK